MDCLQNFFQSVERCERNFILKLKIKFMKISLPNQLLMMGKYFIYGFIIQILCFTLLLAENSQAQKAYNVKEVYISLQFQDEPFIRIMNKIESLTTFKFTYNQEDLKSIGSLSGKFEKASLYDILYNISQQANVKFKQVDENISVSLLKNSRKQAAEFLEIIQTRTISGKVTSYEDNEGLPGVNVVEKGTSNGTVTNVDGEYSLSVNENAILVFSSVGFTTEEVAIGSRSVIDLNMTQDIQQLQELVVVGYGTQEKKLITGATTQVKGESIERLSTTSPLVALQSQTPGVSIIATSARPDADFKINIRGLGTIGDASPLIVINGIVGGDLRSISPFDIESIDILKDAASAAIYGSRAANGVILITTKQGKEGTINVSYDGNYGVQNVYEYLDMVNADQFMNLVNESIQNVGGTPIDFANTLPSDIYDRIQNGWQGTDWWHELSNKNAPVQNHALNINGGSGNSVYSLGLSYTDQEAILGNPLTERFQRLSFRLNSDHVLLKKNNRDIIKVGENLLYTSKNKNNNMANGWRWAASHPLLPVYDENGEFQQPIDFDPDRVNPFAFQYYHSQNEFNSRDLMVNGFLEINPVVGLSFKSNFGSTFTQSDSRSYLPVFRLSPSSERTEDEVNQMLSVNTGYQWYNTLSYDFNINQHNFTTLLGQSIEKNGIGVEINGTNVESIFDSYEYAYLNNTKLIYPGQTRLSGRPNNELSLSSFFARINYDFKERYLLSAVIRRDGSSNFAEGNRWGSFPSLSAGWIMSEEPFLSSISNWLEFLKIRASWGQNGNQNIDNFQYLTTYSFSGANYSFGPDKSVQSIGAYPSILPNRNVTWETSEQLNFGIDSRFFNGKLIANLDFYRKTTKDWLLRAPILASQGAQAPFINGGDVLNKGMELALGWRETKGEFTYGINGNFSINKNEVIRIANTEGIIEGNQVQEYATGQLPPYRAQVGYPIGYFWGYKTAGVFQNQEQIDSYQGALVGDQPGDLIFVDINNDGVINTEDRTNIGDPNPDAILGFSFNLNYKGFDLSMAANGVFGNQILISYHRADGFREHYPTYTLERWHGEGTSNRYPRLTSTPTPNETYFSDNYIEDGDYVRIQNLTIGYDFKTMFQSLPFTELRLFVTAQNLITFTDYIGANPEVGYAPSNWAKGIDVNFNPIPRTFLVGTNIKF
jgi:TonB-linked SusC/RagA family outer membrane protein